MLVPPNLPPPAIFWQHPDTDPFRGSRDEAIALLGIPTPPELMQCKLRQIGDGERFAAMTFGAHSVEYDVVAEPSRWPLRMPTSALDCRYIAGGWEYHVLRPTVCGNYSFERFPIMPSGLPGGGGWADTSWPSWGAAGGYGGGAGEGLGGEGYGNGIGGYGGLAAAGYGGTPISYTATPPNSPPSPPLNFAPPTPPYTPPFTPPVPPYTPPVTPPNSTPEPGSLASLIFALAVWAAYRWRTLWGDLGRERIPEEIEA